jgi:hypothetical protein
MHTLSAQRRRQLKEALPIDRDVRFLGKNCDRVLVAILCAPVRLSSHLITRKTHRAKTLNGGPSPSAPTNDDHAFVFVVSSIFIRHRLSKESSEAGLGKTLRPGTLGALPLFAGNVRVESAVTQSLLLLSMNALKQWIAASAGASSMSPVLTSKQASNTRLTHTMA